MWINHLFVLSYQKCTSFIRSGLEQQRNIFIKLKDIGLMCHFAFVHEARGHNFMFNNPIYITNYLEFGGKKNINFNVQSNGTCAWCCQTKMFHYRLIMSNGILFFRLILILFDSIFESSASVHLKASHVTNIWRLRTSRISSASVVVVMVMLLLELSYRSKLIDVMWNEIENCLF